MKHLITRTQRWLVGDKDCDAQSVSRALCATKSLGVLSSSFLEASWRRASFAGRGSHIFVFQVIICELPETIADLGAGWRRLASNHSRP